MVTLQREAFDIISHQGLEWIECSKLARLPWLLHAFSTRRGGVSRAPVAGLNLGFTEWDQRSNVEQNRKLFLRALGAERFPLATLHQIHSARIYQVLRRPDGRLEHRPAGGFVPTPSRLEGDALLTDQSGILLSVRSADCVPILLVDVRRRAIGAVHGGWRGALEGIIEKAVAEMQHSFGSRPDDLSAAVGPFIHNCCYEVGEEVAKAFCQRFPNGEKFFRKERRAGVEHNAEPEAGSSISPDASGERSRPKQAMCLDLGAVARHRLRHAGIPPSNVHIADFCTSCRTDLFFSHRKEKGRTGRMMAVVAIRPGD